MSKLKSTHDVPVINIKLGPELPPRVAAITLVTDGEIVAQAEYASRPVGRVSKLYRLAEKLARATLADYLSRQ